VLNYQWLYTGAVVAALCAAWIRVERPDGEPIGLPRQGAFLALTLVGLVYVVTRFRPTNAGRYVLLASPIVILLFYHALFSLLASHIARLSYLIVCTALVFLSNFRTLDFVSTSNLRNVHLRLTCASQHAVSHRRIETGHPRVQLRVPSARSTCLVT